MGKESGLAFGGFVIFIGFVSMLSFFGWLFGEKDLPKNLAPKQNIKIASTNLVQ